MGLFKNLIGGGSGNSPLSSQLNAPGSVYGIQGINEIGQYIGAGGGGGTGSVGSVGGIPSMLNYPNTFHQTIPPKKAITSNITSQMLEGEAFQVPLTVAEDLWRAAFGNSWVSVDSLNDFHYGVACRLMFRDRMEKFVVDYDERVRIVE